MANKQLSIAPRNLLLDAFEKESRKRVDPYLERVEFKLGDVICEAGGVLHHAYFPDGAVISLLTVLMDGTAIETANIGREGAFGLFAAMYSRTSFNRSLVQLQGAMVRVRIDILHVEFERSAQIRNLFVSYSETLLAQIQQTVACNALHTTQQRICRWLLMMHDRADGRYLGYTHEFLADVGTAEGRPYQLSSGNHSSSRSLRPRKGVVRVLRCRQKSLEVFLTPPPHTVDRNTVGSK